MKLFTLYRCRYCIALILLIISFQSFGQKTWIGAGAGGAGTDFNTGTNWTPTGVPTATDNVIIAVTTGSPSITLSANASINNLTFTVAGNNNFPGLYVGANRLTVNGTAFIGIVSGNNNTSIEIGVNGGTSAGIIDFVGNATLGTAASAVGSGSGFIGNVNSKFIFRGNITLNQEAYVTTGAGRPGTFEFDGTGTQTLTCNNSAFYCEPNNVVVGNLNNPTLTLAGSVATDNILGNLTLNGSSILNLGTTAWNGGTQNGGTGNAGTLTLNGTSKLQLAANTGGQTGSNFPLRFPTLSIAATSTVEYTGTVAQTVYDIAAPGYGHLAITNNSTKTPTSGLDIRGNLTINSTATFAAGALTHNIGGNFINDNVFTQGTSTMVFNGAALQSISGTTATTFYNLTANNTTGNTTTGITLSRPTTVTNSLTLTSGHITTSNPNYLIMNAGSNVAGSNYGANPKLTSGGSTNSFVNGPMRKIGNTAFLFPVGKISTGTATNYGHHPCGISAPGTATDAFTAEYIRGSASVLGTINIAGLDHVSNCEYWNIDRTTGASNVNVSLSWNTSSSCNTAAYVDNLGSLRASHFNGSNWDNFGGTSDGTSTVMNGSVTWNGVSAFSPFSLGSTSAAFNPLPVKLVNVKAYRSATSNKVEWTNLTEEQVVKYEVERSVSGSKYETMTSVAARSNSNDRQDYSVYDLQPASLTYYRIKVTSIDGEVLYSPVVKVSSGINAVAELNLYPNPVTGKQLTLYVNNTKAVSYSVRIYAANGQVVKTETFKHPGGSYSKTIELPGQLQAGQYFLQATDNEGQVSTLKFITQ